jgi:hypothetical protein
MPQSVFQRSFAGGELAPALHARADQIKYVTGLRTCRNFIVMKQGGVANRSGLRFIASCKTSSASVVLMRYVSENVGQSILIEHGLGYFRFYQNGARVNVAGVAAWSNVTNYVPGDLASFGGVNYYSKTANLNQQPDTNPDDWYALTGTIFEVPAPQATDIYEWVQSGRTITLTHPDQAPQELTFISLTRWTITPITTAPGIAAPTGAAGTAGAAGARTFNYLITAAAAETYEESNPSNVATIAAAADPTEAAPNALTWNAVAGAVEYYVYCDPYENGVYGFIGTADGTAFNDIGFIPDFAVTPPIPRTLFASTNNYPAHAGFYQQRRFFAFTNNTPDGIWASRVGFPSNFGIASPLQDDDALTFRMIGGNHHPVRHLIGLRQLIVLTDAGGWTVGQAKVPLTPNNIPTDQEIYVGSHDKKPVVVGNTLVYIQARGRLLMDARFDQEVEGLGGRDLTIFASHLFEFRSIGRIDYANSPHSIIWCTEGGSRLLGLTYIPEQDVWGWHRHDSGDDTTFDDVCVVPETDEDMLYVIVKRVINSVTVRYIERLEKRFIDPGRFDEDTFFVDSGLSYDGAPATVFTGLGHLEGKIVAVLGDGDVVFDGDPTSPLASQFTVTAGSITIPEAKSVVHIGLPIRFADFETLDLDVQGVDARDKPKRVGNFALLIDRSSRSFLAGPDSTKLKRVRPKPFDTVVDERSGQVEMAITSAFSKDGRIFIRQTDPLPLTILGVIPNVDIGA